MALLDHPVAFLPDITGSIVIAAERGATERALDEFLIERLLADVFAAAGADLRGREIAVHMDQLLAECSERLTQFLGERSEGVVVHLGGKRRILALHAGKVERLHAHCIILLGQLMRFLILPVAPLVDNVLFKLCRALSEFAPPAAPGTKPLCRAIELFQILKRLPAEAGIIAALARIGHEKPVLCVVQPYDLIVMYGNRIGSDHRDRQYEIYMIRSAVAVREHIDITEHGLIGEGTVLLHGDRPDRGQGKMEFAHAGGLIHELFLFAVFSAGLNALHLAGAQARQ